MTRKLILTIGTLVAVIAFAGIVFYGADFSGPVTQGNSESGQQPKILRIHKQAKSLPEVRFKDGAERELTLADFLGKIVLLNVWATWCGPCRHEMPTLDRLQGKLGGEEFEVLALSIDKAGPGAVRKFFEEIGVEHLSLYIDESAKAAHALKAIGLPVTLLLNRKGQEIGRLIGPAEWDTPEMISLFESVINGKRLSGSETGVDLARLN